MRDTSGAMKEIFAEMVGQAGAKQVLESWLANDALPQTLLFVGPPGVGRRLAASLLARQIQGGVSDAHPDTFWFGVVLADLREQSVTAPVKATADLMVRFLERSPLVSDKKVVVVEEMEELTEEAQSAILKTLEEPRADSLIVMIARDESVVLPTILSRAQVVRFVPLRASEISAAVLKLDEAVIPLVQGSLGRARALGANKRTLQSFLDKVDFWKGLGQAGVEERFGMADKYKERTAALEMVEIGLMVMRLELQRSGAVRVAEQVGLLQQTHQRLRQMANPRMALDALMLVL